MIDINKVRELAGIAVKPTTVEAVATAGQGASQAEGSGEVTGRKRSGTDRGRRVNLGQEGLSLDQRLKLLRIDIEAVRLRDSPEWQIPYQIKSALRLWEGIGVNLKCLVDYCQKRGNIPKEWSLSLIDLREILDDPSLAGVIPGVVRERLERYLAKIEASAK